MNIDILNALLTGFFLSFMIGPVFFVLLETSATRGIKHAIIFDLGVVLADIIFITIAYYGSYKLLNAIKDDVRLFVLGGIVLFIYGFITFWKEKKRKIVDSSLVIPEEDSYIALFLKGFLLNFINVGVLGFWLGLVLVVSTNVGMNDQRTFLYFSTIVLGYFITDIAKIILAKQLKNKLTPIVITKIRKVMGVILMFIGLLIASKGFIPEKTINKVKNKVEQAIDKVNN